MRSLPFRQNVVGIFDRTCRTEAQKIVERKAAFIREIFYSVWEILAKTVNDLLTLFFKLLPLIGQKDFRASNISLRRNSNVERC